MTTSVKMYIINSKLRWLQLRDKGLSIQEIAQVSSISRRTLYFWAHKLTHFGPDGLLDLSRKPKSCSRAIPKDVIDKIKTIRLETKFGPDKIILRLQKQYGVNTTARSVARILKRLDLTRKRKRIFVKTKFPKKQAITAGELVQIDVKYARRFNKRWVYQFTATDDFTRLRLTKFYQEQSNYYAMDFLKSVIKFFPFKIQAIKTDNASIFTNRYTGYQKSIDPMNPRLHALDRLCLEYGIAHYLIDPGKPAQNGKVERSHRTDQEEFYDQNEFASFRDLKQKAKKFLDYYNNQREHLGIGGLTPVEKLRTIAKFNNIKSVQYVLA